MKKKLSDWWHETELHSYTNDEGEEVVTNLSNGEFLLGSLVGGGFLTLFFVIAQMLFR